MKLSDVRSETKSMVVSFASGDLKVEYKPHTFTADVADKINAAMADPAQQTSAMFEMVAKNIAGWDLEGDDGKIVPLDNPARLKAEVPMTLFGRIFQAIQEDQDPGKAPARS